MINEFGLFLTSSLSLSIYSDDKDIKIETVQKDISNQKHIHLYILHYDLLVLKYMYNTMYLTTYLNAPLYIINSFEHNAYPLSNICHPWLLM